VLVFTVGNLEGVFIFGLTSSRSAGRLRHGCTVYNSLEEQIHYKSVGWFNVALRILLLLSAHRYVVECTFAGEFESHSLRHYFCYLAFASR
jgi:hypothetical protein